MVKFGLQIPWFSWPGSPDNDAQVLADVARTAEDAGFSSLWVMDHFFQLPMVGDAELDMLEGYTTLPYLAAVTERISLGTLVTGITYRHPGVLVKQVTTLDVLSGGRAWFAVGAAWFEREHKGLGVPFPPLRERFERLEDALQIANQMWSDDNGPFKGKHFTLEETLCSPQPIRRPRPPIMIGGGGEKRTLRLVAQYADACNVAGNAQEIGHKFDVLKRHCDDVGRDYDEIERTVMTIAPPGEAAIDPARALIAAGAQHVIFTGLPVHRLEVLSSFGTDVFPALDEG
ncbi:MAG TPA: LLM class F420-dependent oxidoreductase [Actinomycetota bacterium]|nr:LLM class F420-dependent oxidoreductase [Actinomycetota bacterium]